MELIKEKVEKISKDGICNYSSRAINIRKSIKELGKLTWKEKLFFYDAAASIMEKTA